MPRISDGDYNAARAMLINAGSRTAAASHPKHGNSGDSPEDHGRQLLREAADEFPRGSPQDMEVRVATRAAAQRMNITHW